MTLHLCKEPYADAAEEAQPLPEVPCRRVGQLHVAASPKMLCIDGC